MSLLKTISKGLDTIFPGTGQFLNPDNYSGRKQQNDANAYAMQAWNLANDYNSPKRQVERLVEAGLNPYLVNISGNTAGTPGISGGNVATEAESSFRGLNNIMGTLQGTANLQNTRAQTNLAGAQTGVAGANAALLSAREQGQIEQNKYISQSAIADLDYKREQTKLARAQTAKTQAEADIAQGEADLFGSVGGSKGAGAIGKGISTGVGKGFRILRSILK